MAVPKRKHSNSRSGKRRAHDAKSARQLHDCPSCGHRIPTHVVCPICHKYSGLSYPEKDPELAG
ncbi:MAG TPA: 50S ribosomal protein L32 [Planctomycetaceae bacterium]|nr:50S ribosomal protein L32 [Rhodopirellula sp.]MCH2360565.1 50S ribosomal protein L32 [Pirellulales bacterium]HAL13197.1 50S ribosomal protein L32 [Planctomycetaceae bacterium]HCK71219.1 50S ribosomal protein L32 [Planctomycetaceae bacterium]HCP83712.1 50S ribosomal protein L32 [Planctomycetaceae bacterium]